ncbi:MAG: Sec-independent protein translocase protein TatCy [Candidatus Heimdallarchaeota archaeon LC_2]|nr:MAG: Sec-independent protein translocase protein TatCy [Candidatus Heimdallarchaeota archaeon LC_2]
MSSRGYQKNGKRRSVIDDPNLVKLSSGERMSNYSSQLIMDFNITPKTSISEKTFINYDEMELNQHLIDLWAVLRKIFKVVFITTVIILILPGYADNKILLDPYKPAILQLLNLIIGYTLDSLSRGGDVQVFIGSPLAPITFYLNLGAFVAVLISLPVTVKELMSFIRPGLTDKEWEIMKSLTRIAGGLFVLGAFVAYFIIMPVTLRILAISGGVIGEGELLQMYSLDSVLSLLLWGTLGGGLLYASPVVLLALIDLEIMTPDQIANRKREIIFGIFVIAAFVTPDPTIVSMLILSFPMIIIIEFIIAMGYKIELDKLLG